MHIRDPQAWMVVMGETCAKTLPSATELDADKEEMVVALG